MLAPLREIGLDPMRLMAAYQLKLRSGWLKIRTPRREWSNISLGKLLLHEYSGDPETALKGNLDRNTFFFDRKTDLSNALQDLPDASQERIITEADEILAGSFRLFGGPAIPLGSPPLWNQFPLTDVFPQHSPIAMDKHWSEYSIEALPVDIKLIWEPSRFGWVYNLVRAFRLTDEVGYFEGFWRYLESWRSMNSPNCGPNWISGQEIALRLLSLVFGWFGFYPALEQKPKRLTQLAEMIAVHAERIPITLDYARAQGNNHLISEASALYSVGLLFPEFIRAARWKKIGRKWIEYALAKQFFEDGGYIQHSMNYQRFALQLILWVLKLGELNDELFSDELLVVVNRSVDFLQTFVDPETGEPPNFGHNDGSVAMRLDTCAFRDYRPVIQTAYHLLGHPPAYPRGSWDESAIWLGTLSPGRDKKEKFVGKTNMHVFPDAGLASIDDDETRAVLRCAHFTSRPGQSDQLHVDLWLRNENLLLDPGTYLYNGPYPWDNRFAGSGVHNTIRVDGQEPMRRASKFLWTNWAQGSFNQPKRSTNGRVLAHQADFAGYRSMGVAITRSLVKAGDLGWIVIDRISGRDEHVIRNGWLFPDRPWELDSDRFRLSTPSVELKVESSNVHTMALFREGKCLRGEIALAQATILGWYSPTYTVKEAALSLVVESVGSLPSCLVTYIGLDQPDWGSLSVEWSTLNGKRTGIRRLGLDGDELEL
jgi:hypothetical protein